MSVKPLGAPRLPVMSEHAQIRFWARVQRGAGDGCWEWMGARDRHGYGAVSIKGRRTASRVAYALAFGEIPAGLAVCHHCDNPPCCRPSHLFLGTQADNCRDKAAKGRARAPLGEANGRSKLTAAEVLDIRRRHAAGGVSQRRLGREFGVKHAAVGCILAGRTWGHVT